ncbi:MAG: sulfurtransferase [Methanobacteriota archaeon]
MAAARPSWTTLVDPATLAAAFPDPHVVLLDCRHSLADPEAGPRAFRDGHLPGAVHAHVDRDLSRVPSRGTGRHPLPDPDAFVATASRWGIDADAQVVAYDDLGGAWASRAWWLLRDFGHRAVCVLDGGIPAWARAGLPLEKGDPSPREARRFGGSPGHMPTVTTWQLTTRAPRVLIDARAAPRYRGDEEPIDPVAGHIPTAVNVPFSGNTGPDGRFLPREALRERFAQVLGARGPSDVAVYCGSGVTAPHDILAMEIAGLPGAALYPGSWSEWIRYPLRPVARGGEP